MSAVPAVIDPIDPAVAESVLLRGDLRGLNPAQKISYYKNVCDSLGLNPLTQPFAYITLNGKEMLYAKREAAEQLRKIYQISIEIRCREVIEGCYIVTAMAKMPSGRCDESTGAVGIEGVKGEARANAMLKAETKAKRRVTLSICGLGMLDETEVESIPGAKIGEASVAVTTAPRTFGNPKVSTNGAVDQEGGPAPSSASENTFAGGQTEVKAAPSFQTLPPLEELVEKANEAEKVATGFINREKQLWLIEKFRENLPTRYQAGPISDQMRRGWLKTEGFVGTDGEGTSTVIPDKQFKKVAAAMLNWAKEQQ